MMRETPSFAVFYEPHGPRRGRGDGTGGVRSVSLIDWYCEGLDASARVLVQQLGWERPSAAKTPVYVADLIRQFGLTSENVPFTSADLQGQPYVGLPCRINEPTIQGARWKATADAAHEAAHVLNARYRPFRNANSAPWRWFNEGTAVFAERYVLSGNPDNLRFAMDWCDRPEDSLDSSVAWYQAGLFVHYLVARFGAIFLARVWKESTLRETPIQTIERLLPSSGTPFTRFASPDSAVNDVFGAGYAVDSYSAWGNAAASFAGDAFTRYGDRAITESFELRPGDCVGLHNGRDVLDHLATRYYRFFLDQKVKRLHVWLKSSPADGENRLKGTLVAVNDDSTRGPRVPLAPAAVRSGVGPSTELEATLRVEQPPKFHHVVLVVANCGVRAKSGGGRSPHDDGQEFTVEAKAL